MFSLHLKATIIDKIVMTQSFNKVLQRTKHLPPCPLHLCVAQMTMLLNGRLISSRRCTVKTVPPIISNLCKIH